MPSDDDIALVDRKRLRWDPQSPDSLLGEGSFGVVHRGRYNGTPVAIKVVKRPPPDHNAPEENKTREQAAMKQHRREIHRFQVVQNPYIIQYLGVFRGPNPRDLYIVTEFLEGGSLHDSLSRMRARSAILDDRSFLQIATHIARGLNHVHASQYTHGDMKPQNILLTSAFLFHTQPDATITASFATSAKVKIADFGLSKRLEGAESAGLFGSTTATTDFGVGPCGTYLYMSPEAYQGVSQLSDSDAKAADVYAFGLVLFELLSGLQSWSLERVRNPMHLNTLVRQGDRPAWGLREDDIDPAFIDLVNRCWSQDPCDRPTVDDIVMVLEEQQEAYDHRVAALKDRYASESMSQVTRPTNSSPDVPHHPDSRLADHHRKSPSTSTGKLEKPELDMTSTAARDRDATDRKPSENGGQDYVAKEPNRGLLDLSSLKMNPTGEHDESVLSKKSASIDEDDARTLEDSSEMFSVDEQPVIRPVLSRRLTEDQLEEFYSKQKMRSKGDRSDGYSSKNMDNASDSDKFDSAEEETTSYDAGSTEDSEPEEEERSASNGAHFVPSAGAALPNLPDYPPPNANRDAHVVDSIVGGISIIKVDSVKLIAPKVDDLSLPQDVGGRPVLGTGSVAQDLTLEDNDSRSNADMLQSFMAASLAPLNDANNRELEGEPATSPKEENAGLEAMLSENDQEPSLHTEAPKSTENVDHVSNRTSALAPIAASNPHTPDETAASQANSLQRREKNYSSPNEEIDMDALSEMLEEEDSAFRKAEGVFPQPEETMPSKVAPLAHGPTAQVASRPLHHGQVLNIPGTSGPERASPMSTGLPHQPEHPSMGTPENWQTPAPSYGTLGGHEASAPPLSDTSQSAIGSTFPNGRPFAPGNTPPNYGPTHSHPSSAHMSPGSSYGSDSPMFRIPMSNQRPVTPQVVDIRGVVAVLQRSDAISVLRDWWARGHHQAVAAGLAYAPSLGGEELLGLVRDFIAQNNQLSMDKRDPLVAKDLCTTVGHIARLSSRPLRPDAISSTVLAVLMVLVSFQWCVRQHREVYSSANFALCNLFKVSNVILDTNLRKRVASWIAYSISWNIGQENNGPVDDILAYTATSAARNFMWMNEANVDAFVSCKGEFTHRHPAPIRLITSMRYFDQIGRLKVVEASLTAMAMIAHFRRQRGDFIKLHGSEAVIEVLHKHADNEEIASTACRIITVLFSGPQNYQSAEEMDSVWRSFMDRHACVRFVEALGEINKRVRNDMQRLQSLERGYQALLSVAKFCDPLRTNLIEAGCMPMILTDVQHLAKSIASQTSCIDNELSKARGRLGLMLCELLREFSNDDKGMRYMRANNMSYPLQDMMRYQCGDDSFISCCRVVLSRLAY